MIDPADAGPFLARLLRLDPAALVRLRPAGDGVVELWARLPFEVLVTRRVAADLDRDTTVAAAGLLSHLTEPGDVSSLTRRDQEWRWELPRSRGSAVETIPAAELLRVAEAASRTLREAVGHGVGGRAVGERILRDALLDHIAIVVTGAGGERVDVPQRLVQAVVRMGFLATPPGSPEGPLTGSPGPVTPITEGYENVTVRRVMEWTSIDASYGSVWYRPSSPLRFR